MKKRIIPLFFLVLLLATVMIPTSAAISTGRVKIFSHFSLQALA